MAASPGDLVAPISVQVGRHAGSALPRNLNIGAHNNATQLLAWSYLDSRVCSATAVSRSCSAPSHKIVRCISAVLGCYQWTALNPRFPRQDAYEGMSGRVRSLGSSQSAVAGPRKGCPASLTFKLRRITGDTESLGVSQREGLRCARCAGVLNAVTAPHKTRGIAPF